MNGRVRPAKHPRVPLSNWTELDVWNYIRVENIPIKGARSSSGQLAADARAAVRADAAGREAADGPVPDALAGLLAVHGRGPLNAATIEKIIAELIVTKHSERQLRVIDHDQDGSMEVKSAGCF